MKRFPRIATFIACAAIVTGCAPGAPSGGDVLKRGNGGEPGTLDPSLAEDVHAFNVLADLYEGLMATEADGSLVAGAAMTYTVSADGRTYSFALRPDGRWSNGDAVVAEDFVRRFRNVAAPSTASSYAFLLDSIDNFAEVKAGRKPATALGVTAADSRTLIITLGKPAPWLLSVLTMPVAYPMHRLAARSPQGATQGAVPGNGAYRLVEWLPGESIRLARNPHYWNGSAVAIDDVEFYPVVEPSVELNLFRSGQLHITHTIPPMRVEDLRESMPDALRIAPGLGLYYLAPDLTEPPLDSRPLREALSLAIDREAIVQMLGRGERPAYGLVPPGVAGYTPAEYAWRGLSADARKRRALERYREAGMPDGDRAPIRLVYDSGDVHERIALAVAAMWREVLGLEVELERLEWKLFLATRERRDAWDVMRFSWFGDYDDPTTFTDLFRSDSDQNLPAYANPDYDDALDRAAGSAESGDRPAEIAAAEAMLLDDYPIIPLYFYVSKHLVDPRVVGFESNSLDRHPSRHLSLEESAR